MAGQVIGKIPEFTGEESVTSAEEETKLPKAEEGAAPSSGAESGAETPPEKEGEKETPPTPPVEKEPATVLESEPSDSAGDLKERLNLEIEELKDVKRELILELKDLRGQRRESKEAEIAKVEEKLDDLNDINPDDVQLIERILRAKGYTPKEETQKMLYEARKEEEFEKFFQEFPEYSQDNDPDRRKFGPLLREISLYKEPQDARSYGKVLRKAHRAITGTGVSSGRGAAGAKQRAALAGVGAGGAQRSSSVEPFSPEFRANLKAGGWSDEDIQRMEQRASAE